MKSKKLKVPEGWRRLGERDFIHCTDFEWIKSATVPFIPTVPVMSCHVGSQPCCLSDYPNYFYRRRPIKQQSQNVQPTEPVATKQTAPAIQRTDCNPV